MIRDRVTRYTFVGTLEDVSEVLAFASTTCGDTEFELTPTGYRTANGITSSGRTFTLVIDAEDDTLVTAFELRYGELQTRKQQQDEAMKAHMAANQAAAANYAAQQAASSAQQAINVSNAQMATHQSVVSATQLAQSASQMASILGQAQMAYGNASAGTQVFPAQVAATTGKLTCQATSSTKATGFSLGGNKGKK